MKSADLCPSCEHAAFWHESHGCELTVVRGKPGALLICACGMSAEEIPRWAYDQAADELVPAGNSYETPITTEEDGMSEMQNFRYLDATQQLRYRWLDAGATEEEATDLVAADVLTSRDSTDNIRRLVAFRAGMAAAERRRQTEGGGEG